MKKRLLFTGGGTTGHVTKNLILMRLLKAKYPDLELHYAGVAHGKEADLVKPELAEFHVISSGKLRRYFSLETIPDFFRFLWGMWGSYRLLGRLKPDLVMSSGGYVALPVALAAGVRKIPVISHETDSVPGLANRMIARVAKTVMVGYKAALPAFGEKGVFVGNPVSPELLAGSREEGLKRLRFTDEKPVLLAMGGSQGSAEINHLIWDLAPELVKHWQVVHLTGKGKTRELDFEGYKPIEYVSEGYEDLLAAADVVVCRGGGNSMAEVAALGKTAIIIPLLSAAGDHQTKNAQEMVQRHQGWRMLKNPKADDLKRALEGISKASGPVKGDREAAEKMLQILEQNLDM